MLIDIGGNIKKAEALAVDLLPFIELIEGLTITNTDPLLEKAQRLISLGQMKIQKILNSCKAILVFDIDPLEEEEQLREIWILKEEFVLMGHPQWYYRSDNDYEMIPDTWEPI